MKKIFVILMLAALVGTGIFLVRHKKERMAQAPVQNLPIVVRTAVVTRGSLAVSRTYLARVEPWQTATLSGRMVSRIISISVKEGDTVSRGQVVAVLDHAESLARVRAAEADVARSRMQTKALLASVSSLEKTVVFRAHEFERDTLLVSEGALAAVVAETSADQLSEVRGRLAALQETIGAARQETSVRRRELEQARADLAYAQLRAPFAGVVTRRQADPGDMAGPNQPLMTIEDHHRFKICFDVPQSEMTTLRPGMSATASPDVDRPLRISRVYPAMNPDRTVTVECDTPVTGKGQNRNLHAGSTVPVVVALHRFEDVMLVPEDSLIPAPDGGTVVFAVQNGTTVPLRVTVLGKDNGVVALHGGDGTTVSNGTVLAGTVAAGTAPRGRGAVPGNVNRQTAGSMSPGIVPGMQVVRSTYLGWNRLAAGEQVEVQP
ncbi:MAG: efflux RND transporter periplasmic adaptor subunit [Desulfoplanes sp.]